MKPDPRISIFVDAHLFDGKFQGTRTFILEIYRLLAQKTNLHIYLGAFDIDGLKNHFDPDAKISFIKYRSRSPFIRLSMDIPRIIRKYKIRYAHFQYIVPLRKTCREIVTIHDVLYNEYPAEFSWSYRLVKQFLFKKAASRADLLTTVSFYSKKAIEKYLHIEPERIYVVPNGVHQKFFQPYQRQTAKDFLFEKYGIKDFILYVSRIEPRKNHVGLLKAYLNLRLYEKGHSLVLLGYESIAAPAFDSMFSSLPEEIKKHVFINGTVPDEDLLTFYRGASVFVYPSKAEGFGIPPLEAAAARIPVICSNTTAMSDFRFFGENLIDTLNQEILEERLLNMLSHPPDEESLEKIADIIRREYAWKASAEKLYELVMNTAQ